MIRYFCECGNDDPDLFDVYVTQGDLCDILTVVCKQCGDIREDFVPATGFHNVKTIHAQLCLRAGFFLARLSALL